MYVALMYAGLTMLARVDFVELPFETGLGTTPLHRLTKSLMASFREPPSTWSAGLDKSGVITALLIAMTILTLLVAPLITTQDPPRNGVLQKSLQL